MKYLYAFGLGCLLLPAACKKGGDSISRRDLLARAPWLYESGGLDANKDGVIELSFEAIGLPPCLLDNRGSFNANGTGVTEEGATKCDPMAPASTPFTWSLRNNDTQLNVSGGGFAGVSGNLTIKSITETRMSLTKDTTVMGFPTSLLINLKH